MTAKKQGFFGRIFNPEWDTILNQVINLVFLFFGNKIKGYKTIIVNTITAILGALMAFQAEPMLDFLCSINIEMFCGGESSVFVGYVMVVIGLLNNILRKVTGDQIEEDVNPAAFRIKGGNKTLRVIAIASLAGLVAAIVSMFV